MEQEKEEKETPISMTHITEVIDQKEEDLLEIGPRIRIEETEVIGWEEGTNQPVRRAQIL